MSLTLTLDSGKKAFFVSDFHLGAPSYIESRKREQLIVRWLDEVVAPQAHYLFLLGDLFDFWFEYRRAVPKGFVRFLGKLAEINDKGVKLWFFPGNHDMWVDDYFSVELGMRIHRRPLSLQIAGKRFYIAHGDGLGPGDKTYKKLKKVFESRWGRWIFRQIHPDTGIALACYFSSRSRAQHAADDKHFLGEDEWLWQYAQEIDKHSPHDYYLFGHRHLPLDLPVGDRGARYVNTGEWLSDYTFAVFDGESLSLETYEPQPVL
jgi:UDP-2,3-diacylglucosamine hydrolase